MPIDNSINNRTFEELFSGNVNFEIPFFQRAYSWTREQWKVLFDDIWEQIIADVIEIMNDENPRELITIDLLEKHLSAHEHYFGAIVVLEKRNSQPALKTFSVIDGQQRITTAYILLSIVYELLKTKQDLSQFAPDYVDKLESYIINNIDPKGDDYRKLKIFSNKGDRYPLYLKIFNNPPQSPSLPVDIQLYNPYKNQIDALWSYAQKKIKKYSVPKLYIFSQAILRGLKIVWIPLDEEKDNPQAIFEGLNDKGMPLSSIELLCSYLFKPLIDEVTKSHEDIHHEKWLKSIKEVDGEKNFEFYLRNLLSSGKSKMIGKGRKLYTSFKNSNKNITKQKAFDTLNFISDNVLLFNQITKPQKTAYKHPNKIISKYLIRIEQTNMYSSIPFILALLQDLRDDKIQEQDVISLLSTTYTLLVRRKVCQVKTTKYDVFFPNIYNKIINEQDKNEAFKNEIRKDNLYIDNDEFIKSFIDKPLYKQTEINFARLILQEIDTKMQVHEQLPDYSTIETIEHILPQTIDNEWKQYLGNDANDELVLKNYINTIGNLCLISRKANSSVGQNPFEKKKNSYTEVSGLTRDIKKRNVKWNVDAIKQRSKYLAEKALEIWKW